MFSRSEMSRLVSARSEVQSLDLARAHAETSFRTVLDVYNARMPEIIAEVFLYRDHVIYTPSPLPSPSPSQSPSHRHRHPHRHDYHRCVVLIWSGWIHFVRVPVCTFVLDGSN